MENTWYMLTVVGEDRPGIVAKLTHALFEGGCTLGEASMMRIGGNFTIMMMVSFAGTKKAVAEMVDPVADSLGLHRHIDAFSGGLHQHLIPDVRIRVAGADRPGIVAQVTGALAEAGLHILELQSDVAGSEQKPVYIMVIEGHAAEGLDALESALQIATEGGIDASIESIETMIG